MGELGGCRYRGARALVLLHEQTLREFIGAWRQTETTAVTLPDTDNPSYASPEALLCHVLKWAGRYMLCTCEKLELPGPGIAPLPAAAALEEQANEYVDLLLRAWRERLRDVSKEKFFMPEYVAP